MMNIIDFNNAKLSNLQYGGSGGDKLGIIYNNCKWFLKFAKSTSQFNKTVNMSRSTSYLSEYIGSHIYELLGIPVHQTLLGIYDKRLVVACKDFTGDNPSLEFEDFHSIKNMYVRGLDEKLSLSSSSNSNSMALEDIEIIMNNNPTFRDNPSLKERFWDMFIVDALIGNNDRNNGNWGVLVDRRDGNVSIAPVFDNGASFSGNIDDDKIKSIMNDEKRFIQSVYTSRICFFTHNDRLINPLKYIESMNDINCNAALLRIVPKVNKEKIFEVINSIPHYYKDIEVISDERRKFYLKCLEYRIDNILIPIYKILCNK